MTQIPRLTPLLVALAALPCSAQSGGGEKPAERWNVEVKFADGRTFQGVLTLAELTVEGDVGEYAIKPEKIKEVRIPEQAAESLILHQGGRIQVDGTIVTIADEAFAGRVMLPGEGIKTGLGTLKPNPLKLRTLIFKGRAPALAVASEPALSPGKPKDPGPGVAPAPPR